MSEEGSNAKPVGPPEHSHLPGLPGAVPDEVETLTRVVIEDVNDAMQLVEAEPGPGRRRAAVRAVFAAIEGLLWELKEDIARVYPANAGITRVADLALLRDEGYRVGSRGEVRTTPTFAPLPQNIRFTAKVLQRIRQEYEYDFSGQGWEALVASVEVRHRLTHPKTEASLEVTEEELGRCVAAFYWFLAFIIVARRELAYDHLRPSARRSSDKAVDRG